MNHTTTVETLIKFLRKFDPGAKVTFLVDGCQAVKIWEMYGTDRPMITLKTTVDAIDARDHVEPWPVDHPEDVA